MNMNALSLNSYYYRIFIRINQVYYLKLIITNCEKLFYTFNDPVSILYLEAVMHVKNIFIFLLLKKTNSGLMHKKTGISP